LLVKAGSGVATLLGGGPLVGYGRGYTSEAILDEGLDRFRVVVFPVITGATGNERIFDGYPDIALELIESRTFDDRLQLLEYVPTLLDGPPGIGDWPDLN